MDIPSLRDFRKASERLKPFVSRTPVHHWKGPLLSAEIEPHTQVHLKLELFQLTGTFKYRGALLNLMDLDDEARARGVTAVSAGNHATAVASAAQTMGVNAKVVMMASANPARVKAAKSYGAEVLFAPDGATAFALAEDLARTEGRTLIHPFDGRNVHLGTGTVGLELLEDVPNLDAVIVAVGGGGLAGGVGAAIKSLNPNCKVYGVEPTGNDVMFRSFQTGKPEAQAKSTTICDSLSPPAVTLGSYAICREVLDDILRVSDDEACHALALLFTEMKLAVEPAAAVAAAGLFGPLRKQLSGQTVGIVICGANIDADSFHSYLKRGLEQ